MKILNFGFAMVLAVLGMCVLPASAHAYDLYGKVVYVDDGDTVVLLTENNSQEKIRLASIDAPESSHTKHEKGRIGQPFSKNSGDYLSSLVKGKNVVARCYERDRYQRNVCDIHVESVFVNLEMVVSGLAWANVSAGGRYLRDKSFPALEAAARSRKTGLWAGPGAVPPWEWRDTCWKQQKCDLKSQ
jgi:micrococcal nuclease